MAQQVRNDRILFVTVIAMFSLGMVMVYSASSVMAELKFGSAWHFVVQQTLAGAAAIGIMMLLKNTHYRRLQHPAVAFSGIGFALILLLAVYLVDSTHHRWLRVGPVGLQPSELAKPALVVFLAYFVAWRARAINNRYTLLPAALAAGLVIFAVVIADLGTAVVLGLTAIVVFFVAGLEWRYFAIVSALGMVGMLVFVASKPYRLARVVGYIDPESRIVGTIDPTGTIESWLESYLRKSLTTRDTSYQADQSKIAVGAGGPLGLGLMQGKQKLLYLPEAHTDFIYAVVGEELGLVGATALLAGFIVILWRGLRASVLIPDDFGRYLALGVTTMIVLQGFMNMSVVLGLMPTKGIPLPLVSAGGSSLLSTLASLGILMNVAENAG